MNRESRQKYMRERLNFTCDCLACVEDYPVLPAYEMFQSYGMVDLVNHFKLCDDYQFDVVKTLIPKYCEFLTQKSAEYPLNYTATAEEVLLELFELVYTDAVPLTEKIRLEM